MSNDSLPPALVLVVGRHNEAAGATLLSALPHLEPSAQVAAVRAMVSTPDAAATTSLIVGFDGFSPALRSVIADQANGLYPALRRAIASEVLEERLGAIELIATGPAYASAPLLAEGLRSRCPRTGTNAATALRGLTAAWLDRRQRTPGADRSSLQAAGAGLRDALAVAIRQWELHRRGEVLEAAGWLAHRTETSIRRKLRERQARIVQPLVALLERTRDPRLAGFVFRSVGIPELQASAIRAIRRASEPAFVRVLLQNTWLLADPEIERGCRRLGEPVWLEAALSGGLDLDSPQTVGLVRLCEAMGGRRAGKFEQYRERLQSDQTQLRLELVWRLIRDPSAESTSLLGHVVDALADDPRRIVQNELRRRKRRSDKAAGMRLRPAGPEPVRLASGEAVVAAFEEAWEGTHRVSDISAGDGIEPETGDSRQRLIHIRAGLGSPQSADRLDALRSVKRLGLATAMAEQVFRAAHDGDAHVRSQAVALLAGLPGATSTRILRRALDDPDARVQANAIEAMETLAVDNRVRWIEPKLLAGNGRVRAGAVKTLLPLELRQAAEVLLDMLADPRPAHRRSGLWVVGRLGLRATAEDVGTMAQDDPDHRVRASARRVLNELGVRPAEYSCGAEDRAKVTVSSPAPGGTGGGVA